MTDRLPGIRELVQAALTDNADLLYRHTGTWSDGTACRFSVQDPSKVQGAFAASLRQQPEALLLRIIRVHPADTRPARGATTDWQGYPLTLVAWSDESDFTGQRLGTGRLEQ